jgi:hypothetical protein
MEYKVVAAGRKRESVDYRHFLMYNMHETMKISVAEISRILGIDRASVYYGIKKHGERKTLYGDDYYKHDIYTPIGELKDTMYSNTLPSKYKCKDGDWYFCKKTYKFKKKGTEIRINASHVKDKV